MVGVPDPKSGEAVKAYIQLKPGETATAEEIMAFCKDHMAGYKRPKHIEFRDTPRFFRLRLELMAVVPIDRIVPRFTSCSARSRNDQ